MHRTAAALLLLTTAAAAHAAPYQITITGRVEYNQVSSGPLAVVAANDPVTISFRVDSNSFVDSPNFPTRGYTIDRPSFTCTLGSATLLLEGVDAKLSGDFFTLRNNDPGVDGFMLTHDNVELDNSLPSNVAGAFGQFGIRQYTTYDSTLIPSLNIADAVGSYEYDTLSVYGFAITDGPFDPIGIEFLQTTIAIVPPPTCPGDTNADGIVNSADLSVLLAQFNQSVPPGTGADFNNDALVNGADLSVLLGAFGSDCTPKW